MLCLRCLLTLIISMNILFTSSTPFHPLSGGMAIVTDTLCKSFQQKGHCVWYMHHNWYRDEYKYYSYPAPVAILPNFNKEAQENHQFYIDFLKRHQIDIVICQDALYNLTFQRVGDLPVKVISVIHSNPLHDYNFLWRQFITLRDDSFTERLRRIARCALYLKVKRQMWNHTVSHFNALYSLSDKILLLSPYYIPLIQRLNEKLLKKTGYIYNPNTYPLQNELPTRKRQEIIIVGRCHKSKRIDRLLKIWDSLWKEFPDWHLSVLGEGPDKENLIKLANKLELGNMTFVGFQDPLTYYKQASIICMTSDFEGFPMVLVEAMQFGCVPIAFESFEAVHDIILQGKTGEVVKPFDLKEFRRRLSMLMESDDYRERLSIAAFEHVKRFDVSGITEQWEHLFEVS